MTILYLTSLLKSPLVDGFECEKLSDVNFEIYIINFEFLGKYTYKLKIYAYLILIKSLSENNQLTSKIFVI